MKTAQAEGRRVEPNGRSDPAESVGPRSGSSAGWVLLPSWVALAWLVSKAQWVWTHRPEMQFGWLVAILSAYLIWEKWAEAPPPQFRLRLGSLLGAALGVGLLAVVQVYQAAFGTNAASLCAHALGTLMIVAANLHYAFGWAGIRVFAFPFAFVLVAMPLPSAVQGPVTHALQGLVTALNVEILNLLGIPARRVGSLIHLPSGTVGVDEACSGIRSLQSSIMATLFIGYLSLRNPGLRGLLFVGGMIAAVLGNLIRSLVLSFAAGSRGIAAVQEVHDAAGWSILVFTAGAVGLLAWFLMRIERRAAETATGRAGAAPGP